MGPALVLLAGLLGCNRATTPAPPLTDRPAAEPAAAEPAAAAPVSAPDPEEERFMAARQNMVRRQLQGRDIDDPVVLTAMGAVRRHQFIPTMGRPYAYDDSPVPIGHDQTISQPYIVAFMTQALDVKPGMRVLEVGTGSGYQAAVLSELGAEVWSIEIVEPLAAWADQRLRAAGYPVVESDAGPDGQAARDPAAPHRGGIHLRTGDGYRGWPETGGAPFDRVIVTAAPDHVPPALKDQLVDGGRLIIPVGDQSLQHLLLIERRGEAFVEDRVLPVRFVPMTGQAQTGEPESGEAPAGDASE